MVDAEIRRGSINLPLRRNFSVSFFSCLTPSHASGKERSLKNAPFFNKLFCLRRSVFSLGGLRWSFSGSRCLWGSWHYLLHLNKFPKANTINRKSTLESASVQIIAGDSQASVSDRRRGREAHGGVEPVALLLNTLDGVFLAGCRRPGRMPFPKVNVMKFDQIEPASYDQSVVTYCRRNVRTRFSFINCVVGGDPSVGVALAEGPYLKIGRRSRMRCAAVFQKNLETHEA